MRQFLKNVTFLFSMFIINIKYDYSQIKSFPLIFEIAKNRGLFIN